MSSIISTLRFRNYKKSFKLPNYFQKKIDHLDLIEGIVVDLLKVKWRCFIQKNFMNQIARFVVYFLIASYVFIVRPSNGHGDECVPISR